MATTNQPKDIEQTHPNYDFRRPDWQLMQDAYEGERRIKMRGNVYLPETSGQIALGLGTDTNGRKPGQILYDAYKLRANYPSLVKDTANALVGILNREPPVIELPTAMEPLLESATDQGEPLSALLRRIQLYQLLDGRRGLLVDVDENKNLPYLIDTPALKLINWDDVAPTGQAERQLTLTVLDETRFVRDGFRWEEQEKFRALELRDGRYVVTIEDKGVRLPEIVPSIQGTTLDFIPYTFINSSDLVPMPSDIPLLGLANLALTIYRGDADYRQALFMQGQDTLVIIGEDIDPDNPDEQVIVGAGAMINLPTSKNEADAKFIGAESDGIAEMRTAQENDFDRAQNYGMQMMSKGAGAEAAETLKIRVAARTADLVSIAQTSAAGLEQALKHAAVWIGSNPDEVRVEPNTDFIDETMPAAELLGYMNAKSRGAPLSTKSVHALMRKGDVTQLTFEEEQEAIDEEEPVDDVTGVGEPGAVDEQGNPIDENAGGGQEDDDDQDE